MDRDDDEGRAAVPELARVEADIRRSREQVADSMLALRAEVARRTDWRAWVARARAAFLGGAVALGFVWGFRQRGGQASTGGDQWK